MGNADDRKDFNPSKAEAAADRKVDDKTDAKVMSAAIVEVLRRKDTPPVNFLKKEDKNPAFAATNVAAKNVHSSYQQAHPASRVRRKPKLRLTKREQALNEPKAESK